MLVEQSIAAVYDLSRYCCRCLYTCAHVDACQHVRCRCFKYVLHNVFLGLKKLHHQVVDFAIFHMMN